MQPAEAAAQPYPRSGFSTLVLKFRNYLFCDDLGLDEVQGWYDFNKERGPPGHAPGRPRSEEPVTPTQPRSQYSSGSRSVVEERSASVMIHSLVPLFVR